MWLALPWLVWVIIVPLLAAALAFLVRRHGALIGLLAAAIQTLCVVLVVWQTTQSGPLMHAVGGWDAPLGIRLQVDSLSALMLALTAAVGLAVTVYATRYYAPSSGRPGYFWPLWLLLWSSLNALFLSADIFNVYVTLELLGLSAVALTSLARTPAALGAAIRYLFVSMLGSLVYLMGVAVLYAQYGTLDMAQLSGQVVPSAPSWTALGLMTAGLALKTALFPLHFWLPPAHANAPAPVSALLSALVVKASFYLLLRLWFDVFGAVPLPAAIQLIGVLGAAAVLWGSLQAIRQQRLKLMVAYSTVAQIGYLFLAFPVILATGTHAWTGAIYLALSHGLAKAAMFLGAGTLMQAAGHDRIDGLGTVAPRLPITMLAIALAGISLIGLPPSGGFVGKWQLLTAAIAGAQWWWAAIILIGGLLAAVYMFRVMALAFSDTPPPAPKPVGRRLEWSALCLALAASLLGLIAYFPTEMLEGDAPRWLQNPGGD